MSLYIIIISFLLILIIYLLLKIKKNNKMTNEFKILIIKYQYINHKNLIIKNNIITTLKELLNEIKK
jgi:hypothetical protein